MSEEKYKFFPLLLEKSERKTKEKEREGPSEEEECVSYLYMPTHPIITVHRVHIIHISLLHLFFLLFFTAVPEKFLFTTNKMLKK